ncbi:MAG: LysR family transcriptional regulator [Bdellovibrionota bacterium]
MDIELYGLRIFYQVMTDKTFSAAAKALRITQPTVSQQIAKLETRLGGKLFERVGHDLIPTHLAKQLHPLACSMIEMVDEFSEQLQSQRVSLRGPVQYAMPESCQWTPHYRRIMNQIAELPEVHFRIEILPNEQIIKGLVEGQFDFGFVVGERVAPELRFSKFSDEAYSAAASSKNFFKPLQPGGKIESLRLITYPGWELFFTTWANAHGYWKSARSKLPEPAVHIGTLAGAIHAVQEGAGAGIIPTHCIQDELDSGRLLEWKSGKVASVSNPVYIARRIGEKLPKRVETVIEMLRKSKADTG